MESDSFLQTSVSRDHKNASQLPPLFGEPDETKTEELGQKRTDRTAKMETKGQPGMKRVLFGHDSHLKSHNTFDPIILRAKFLVLDIFGHDSHWGLAQSAQPTPKWTKRESIKSSEIRPKIYVDLT